MKVLVADLFSEDGIKDMLNAGLEVTYEHALAGETLVKAISEL
jgi:hypothetical protein